MIRLLMLTVVLLAAVLVAMIHRTESSMEGAFATPYATSEVAAFENDAPETREGGTDASASRVEVADPGVGAESSSCGDDKRIRLGDLTGGQGDNIALVNRVLKRAGCQSIDPDVLVEPEYLAILDDMIARTNHEINSAARSVLKFQEPFAKEMRAQIKAAVEANRPVPYEVLPGGVLPGRGVYDLLVTTAYRGVVYVGKMPMSPALFETVDRQLIAERTRLQAFQQWVAGLH